MAHIDMSEQPELTEHKRTIGRTETGTVTRNIGTLTVTVGSESVTLNPMDPWDKFNRDKAAIDRLLGGFAPRRSR